MKPKADVKMGIVTISYDTCMRRVNMTTTFETQVIEILNDLVRKVSRLETRLMRLAEEMNVNVTKRKEKQDENVQ
jgi:hypothetical protein